MKWHELSSNKNPTWTPVATSLGVDGLRGASFTKGNLNAKADFKQCMNYVADFS